MGRLAVLAGWLETHLFFTKAVATGVVFLWNFSTRYFWILDMETSGA